MTVLENAVRSWSLLIRMLLIKKTNPTRCKFGYCRSKRIVICMGPKNWQRWGLSTWIRGRCIAVQPNNNWDPEFRLSSHSRSSKWTLRSGIYEFRTVIHINYGPISYCSWHKRIHSKICRKSQKIPKTSELTASAESFMSEFCNVVCSQKKTTPLLYSYMVVRKKWRCIQ